MTVSKSQNLCNHLAQKSYMMP